MPKPTKPEAVFGSKNGRPFVQITFPQNVTETQEIGFGQTFLGARDEFIFRVRVDALQFTLADNSRSEIEARAILGEMTRKLLVGDIQDSPTVACFLKIPESVSA
ncbi:MAG: hypothetical protein AAB519_04095 [Patescibacteria group bacterium]